MKEVTAVWRLFPGKLISIFNKASILKMGCRVPYYYKIYRVANSPISKEAKR